MGEPLASRTCESPLGELILVGTRTGLREILWEEDDVPAGTERRGNDVLEDGAEQLGAYFAGALRRFELPLDLVGTPFQLQAWRALADVPYGTTVSYGEQARRLGRPAAARAVGAANGRNPVPIVLPCHRIVGADRSLVGFGGGLDRKAWLLSHEARVAAAAG
jgi:methylated-DNA-[protein]-cysteine S-methyltransferase